MTMEKHISSVCKSCYGQLRQIGHIRKYLNTDATKSLVNSLVTSRMDYCNVLLCGVPKNLLNKLQHLQNTAARIITRTSRYDHVTPILKDLHWLPVTKRVDFKILVHTYKSLNDQSPRYLKDLLEIHEPTRNLRSNDQDSEIWRTQFFIHCAKIVEFSSDNYKRVKNCHNIQKIIEDTLFQTSIQ